MVERWCTEIESIDRIVQSYYEDLFSSKKPAMEAINRVLSFVHPRVTESMNDKLLAPFTNDDVRKATFELSSNKVPGSDGFPASFYRSSWHIIGRDVSSCLLSILNEGGELSIGNNTIISLIRKISTPSMVKDYRPINLYDVRHKILARAITNRLAPVMADIIDPSQSAFVPERLITDNILIAYIDCIRVYALATDIRRHDRGICGAETGYK